MPHRIFILTSLALLLSFNITSSSETSTHYTFLDAPVIGSQTDTAYAGIASNLSSNNLPTWNNAFFGAIGADNGNYTNVNLAPGATSSLLLTYDYRFNIPCNAIITSVTVEITRRNSGAGDVVDSEVRLRLPDYTSSPLNLSNATAWLQSNTASETIVYAHQDWGSNLTPDIINASTFGVIISAENLDASSSAVAEIDAINVVVCYDLPGVAYFPIDVEIEKTADECNQGMGGITVLPRGGAGLYEYSIDGGTTWTTNPVFENLVGGDYQVQVRNSDGSCETAVFLCMVPNEERLVQYGDAVVACRPTLGEEITLVIESIQPFGDLVQSGSLGQDVSSQIQPQTKSYTTTQLCGEVFSVALDEEGSLYTGTTTLYNIGSIGSAVLSFIDWETGAVTKLATLPGNYGIGGLDYDTECDQLFVSNLEDGIIYRVEAGNGTILSTFDPLLPDAGSIGLAPLGERILGVTYNPTDSRLYYSVWVNDRVDNGGRNVIRSIEIDPNTCDFIPSTDMLELELPFRSEACGNVAELYSMPVTDIEFDQSGTVMLLSESGFNSAIPIATAHQARLLEYDGSSGLWTIDTGGNANNCKYQIGINGGGSNSRGGTDFAYDSFNGVCTQEDESHIVVTGDALAGISCFEEGCYYGLQYFNQSTGGDLSSSILLDMDRDATSQTKSVYGDVDVFLGCSEAVVGCIAQPINPSCSQGTDGLIEVIGQGGSNNYEYSIDNGITFQTSNQFLNLSDGMYTIIIRDTEEECTCNCTAILTAPASSNCFNMTFSRNN